MNRWEPAESHHWIYFYIASQQLIFGDMPHTDWWSHQIFKCPLIDLPLWTYPVLYSQPSPRSMVAGWLCTVYLWDSQEHFVVQNFISCWPDSVGFMYLRGFRVNVSANDSREVIYICINKPVSSLWNRHVEEQSSSSNQPYFILRAFELLTDNVRLSEEISDTFIIAQSISKT